MCVYGCVCLSVCQHSHGWMDLRMVTKFCTTDLDLDDLSHKFDGQGHRSKVKVTRPKMWFSWFSHLSDQIKNAGYAMMSWHYVTSWHDSNGITTSCNVTGSKQNTFNSLGNSFGIMKFTWKQCVFEGFFFDGVNTLKRSQ